MNAIFAMLTKPWFPQHWLESRYFYFTTVGLGVGVSIMLLAPFGDSPANQLISLVTGLVFVLCSVGVLFGLSERLCIHLALTTGVFNLIFEAVTTGGLFSMTMAWVALLPLLPMLLLPILDACVWFVISNLIYLGMWWSMTHGWLPDEWITDAQSHWYNGANYVVSCIVVLALPLVSERNFKINMALRQAREQELLEKRADLWRAQTFKDSFISTLSHELRTPMNAILGFNDLLSVRLKNNPQALELVNLSRQSGEHLLTVINDVLDFSQMQLGQLKIHPEPFDLRTTVHSAFKLFEQRVESMDIDYQLQLAEDLPITIHSDRHRLMQILVNLLGNAIKFTHQGAVSLTVKRDGADLLFEVRDTGIGVAPDRIDKIFDRFEQATLHTASIYGGNGLGLSICHDLVNLLGGRIGANSVLGQGSCFWMRLPIQEATQISTASPELISAPMWRDVPVRFLIVDDHPVNRLLACHMVQSHWPKAVLFQADNGQQALGYLKQSPIDFVLMDMVMPEMDGVEATREIRQTMPSPQCDVPIVLLTANVNPQDHVRGQEAGINALMVKPFDRVKLCTLIEEELLGSGAFVQRLAHLRSEST